MKCRYCGSANLWRRGKRKRFGKETIDYQCRKCKKFQSGEPKHYRSARILLLDIETLPGEYYAFDPKVDYLTPDKMIKDWSISCWAAKWLFEPEIMGQAVTGKEAVEREDSSILERIWHLMNEADVIVTHNGIGFDIKKLNTKFVLNRFPPPSHYLMVDTYKTAKEVFGFSYNRLDELGKKLGIGSKTEMVFNDWKQCVSGDREYIAKMLDYCKKDVAPLLEDVYVKFLPWIPNHPNLNIFTDHDKPVCPKCESGDLSWNTTYKTPQGLWEGFRCNACGAIGRSTAKGFKIKATHIK